MKAFFINTANVENITLGEFVKKYNKVPYCYANSPEMHCDNEEGYLFISNIDDNVSVDYIPKNYSKNSNIYITNNDELADTIIPMISSDYKKRFIAEFNQLQNRFIGLLNMLNKWDNNNLDFSPTCNRSIYDNQIKYMLGYIRILIERAYIEDVNLSIKDDLAYYLENN